MGQQVRGKVSPGVCSFDCVRVIPAVSLLTRAGGQVDAGWLMSMDGGISVDLLLPHLVQKIQSLPMVHFLSLVESLTDVVDARHHGLSREDRGPR